ncbi:hypothetical protein [Massilia antarctica]|uniref:hypothetical protein n=1 Tax=Massilia antarctica TaxID=2765360 RepID=UPI0022714E4E|nr:hypothetical protein [Massilia sp. H27-R4]MCY0910400.1 hypothetical protein [Massilia sp. H27-R4]
MFAFIVSIFSKESCMWLVAIAWIYVVGLMAITEHSIVAGIMTFLGYCVLPLSIVWYIAGSKMRRMKIAHKEEQARSANALRASTLTTSRAATIPATPATPAGAIAAAATAAATAAVVTAAAATAAPAATSAAGLIRSRSGWPGGP